MKRKVNRISDKVKMLSLAGMLSLSLVSAPAAAIADENVNNDRIEITNVKEFGEEDNNVRCQINEYAKTVNIIVFDNAVATLTQEEIETLIDGDQDMLKIAGYTIARPLLERAYYRDMGYRTINDWNVETGIEVCFPWQDAFPTDIFDAGEVIIRVDGVDIKTLNEEEFIKLINNNPDEKDVYISNGIQEVNCTIRDLKRAYYIAEGSNISFEADYTAGIVAVCLMIVFAISITVHSEMKEYRYFNKNKR